MFYLLICICPPGFPLGKLKFVKLYWLIVLSHLIKGWIHYSLPTVSEDYFCELQIRVYLFVFKITLLLWSIFSFFHINSIKNLCLEDQIFLYSANTDLLNICQVLSLVSWAGNTNCRRQFAPRGMCPGDRCMTR